MSFPKLLTEHWGKPENRTLAGYQKVGGYEGARKALGMDPKALIEEVKKSNLRGAGGAGFPPGMKWSFVPKVEGQPRYLTINADEGEPGTYKDRYIMERDPHRLIEGIIVCCWAVGINTAYIYLRGELFEAAATLEKALAECYAAGVLGPKVLGTGHKLDVYLHRGAGAYICGEESALLESLEGKKGFPRLRPPFPAVKGLFGQPTVINNVETLAALPGLMKVGAEAFAALGVDGNGGTKLYPVSGLVKRPGIYELPMGTPLRTIIFDHCGGLLEGRTLKGVIPGGSSTPVLTPRPHQKLTEYLAKWKGPKGYTAPANPEEIDVPMDFNSLRIVDSLLGTGAVMVLDDTVCAVRSLWRLLKFYAHESCGQCVPCREGTGWLERALWRIENGGATPNDVSMLDTIAGGIMGTTICALGDAAAMPTKAFYKQFKPEFEQHITLGRCPFKPYAVRPAELTIA